MIECFGQWSEEQLLTRFFGRLRVYLPYHYHYHHHLHHQSVAAALMPTYIIDSRTRFKKRISRISKLIVFIEYFPDSKHNFFCILHTYDSHRHGFADLHLLENRFRSQPQNSLSTKLKTITSHTDNNNNSSWSNNISKDIFLLNRQLTKHDQFNSKIRLNRVECACA